MSNIMNNASEKAPKPMVAVVESNNGLIDILVDTSISVDDIKAVPANDKGNRTLVYQKWTDEESGITFQLTGYITNTNLVKREEEYKATELTRLQKEATELKAQMAQFQSLMNNPEMQALINKLGNKQE